MSCAVSRNMWTPNYFCDPQAAFSHAFLQWFFYSLHTKKNLIVFRIWCFHCCPGNSPENMLNEGADSKFPELHLCLEKVTSLDSTLDKALLKAAACLFLVFFLRYLRRLWNAISSMLNNNNSKKRWGFYTSPATCCSELKNRKTTAEEGSRVTPCVTLRLSSFPPKNCDRVSFTEVRHFHIVSASQNHTEWVRYISTRADTCFLYIYTHTHVYVSKSRT